MSHHFDTQTAKQNPGLNICDMYLFRGEHGRTVMAMTVSADVGISSPDVLPLEGLYAFRFDLNGDAREDVVFKFRFGEPRHIDGDEHRHVQPFQVSRARGDQIPGDAGEVLLTGETGKTITASGVSAFVGVAPELWAADAIAFFDFLTAFHSENRFNPDTFGRGKNFFGNRNVMALVLEVPTTLIGTGNVRAWATASLYGHAPEVQISRWGLPLFTHLFLSGLASSGLADRFHASVPSQDVELFGAAVADFTSGLAGRAGFCESPVEYGRQLASRLCPATLPYELGTNATFDRARFNGRPLTADAFDVMLSLATNTPIADSVAPDGSRIRSDFPYYGERYSREEQAELGPISTGFYDQ